MKKISSSPEFKAALDASGTSIENIRTAVGQQCADLALFKPDTGTNWGGPWVRDLLSPEDGATWCAIISAPNGKTYEQDFTIDKGVVTLIGDPREVIAQVDYAPAPKELESSQLTDPENELLAGDVPGHEFHGNQHTSGETAAAVKKSVAANAKSKDAIAKNDVASNEAAADAHTEAMTAHNRAAEKAQNSGDNKLAAMHRSAATQHGHAAWMHNENAAKLKSAKPVDASAPIEKKTIIPLEAAFAIEAPQKFDAFMVMPAGVQEVTLGRLGKAHTITVNVNPAGAKARQAHLDAVNRACKLKAFNCFDHQKTAASSHPKKYWWEDGRTAGRPAGIYESAEPTSAGLDAVSGKVYQGWSETFYVDDEFAGPDSPALIINPLEDPLDADGSRKDPNDYRVMGTLTNRPAFTKNEPLFASRQNNSPSADAAARNAGAPLSSKTQNENQMKQPLDAAALQARIDQLEQDIKGYEAKDDALSKAELRASRSELEARQAELELSKNKEKMTSLEASETRRKEEAADAAVAVGLEAQAIPMLDKKAQGEWREKFIADPTLIPLMANAWKGSKKNGVTTRGTTSAALGYGDVKPGANAIIRALSATMEKQRPIKGLDAEANSKRSMIAREAAIIWDKEIRIYELDAEGRKMPTIRAEFILAPLDAALDAAADTDTIGTLAGTFVAQRYLDIFMYKLPLISGGRIMTDFSDQPSDLNQVVNTRKIIVPAVVSFDPTLDTDGYPKGWAPANAAQTTDINITLDELIGVPIQFDLAALSSTQRQLFMEQAPAAAYANALYFLKKIYAVCTAANFNAYAAITAADANGIVKVPTAYATYTVAMIDFARSKIAEVAAAFDANEVPDEDRTVLLNAGYYNKATSDPSLVTFFAGQQSPEIVTQGKLPSLAGFVPIKAPNFPGTTNRFGMFLQKNGLLAKSRLPNNLNTVIPGGGNGSVTQIVHPDTGMPLLLTQWTDHKRGYSAWNPCSILGAAKGDTRGGIVGTTQ